MDDDSKQEDLEPTELAATESMSMGGAPGQQIVVKPNQGNWKSDQVNRYAHRADTHIRAADERLAEILEHTTDTPDPERPVELVK